MKNLYLFLFGVASILGVAQTCPSNLTTYYASATGTGATLKTQLHNIINSHTTISYTPGLWNLYYTSDVRPDGKVWDIYSNCNFIFGTPAATGGNQDDGTGGSLECQRYNREHTFPKSWFGGSSGIPMYTDAFHVMPTDKKDNGARGNMPYGIVGGTATYTTNNGAKIGICTATGSPSNLTVFEPADQYKGDVARNYFYMATCYEDKIVSWQNIDANGAKVLDGTTFPCYQSWYLNLMLKWHLDDPVSQKEIDRNNAVCAVQNNRNPFIDHPEYVCQIWGPALCASLSNELFSLNENNLKVYPNPSNGNFNITFPESNGNFSIEVLSVIGQKIYEKNNINTDKFTVDNLENGVYLLKISKDSQTIVKKIVIN